MSGGWRVASEDKAKAVVGGWWRMASEDKAISSLNYGKDRSTNDYARYLPATRHPSPATPIRP